MSKRISQKIALITGAASGIGHATAELFIAEGATVILADINDPAGEALTKKLGPDAYYHHLDVSQELHWQKIQSWITEKWGYLDILFNNAGIMGYGQGAQDPEHCTLESWHKTHQINLDSVFLGCRMGIALMKGRNASIINMSSRSGIVGVANAAAYSSSKAAIRNFSKTVALYCAKQGYLIRCNSLHPGAILTPLWNPMLGDEKDRTQSIQEIARGIPLQHMGEPKDVAYAALYFASEESAYITGSELVIDGGILAGSAAAPQKIK